MSETQGSSMIEVPQDIIDAQEKNRIDQESAAAAQSAEADEVRQGITDSMPDFTPMPQPEAPVVEQVEVPQSVIDSLEARRVEEARVAAARTEAAAVIAQHIKDTEPKSAE